MFTLSSVKRNFWQIVIWLWNYLTSWWYSIFKSKFYKLIALTRNNMSVPVPNRTANTCNVLTYFRWIINCRESTWGDLITLQFNTTFSFLKIRPVADQNRPKPISVGCFYWTNVLYPMMCACERGMCLVFLFFGEKRSSFSTQSVMTHHLGIGLTDFYIVQPCYYFPE